MGTKMMTGVAAAAVLGLAGLSQAAPVYYEVNNISVDAYTGTNNGLTIETSTYSPSGFTLDDGECHTFAAFDIWTDEGSISSDDLKKKSISVELEFSAPGGTATIGGDTFGTGKFLLFGFINEEGHVRWDGPTIVDLGSVVYQVALCDADFNYGLIDLNGGECYGATVHAKVTQISSVPTPAAAGIGLAMISGMVMKRRKAQA